MLAKIPSQAAMIDLIGQPLLEVWQALCSAIDAKWNGRGIPAAKDGRMRINTAGAERRSAVCMQKAIESVSWSSSAKKNGQESKQCETRFPLPSAKNTRKRKPITTENGSCSSRRTSRNLMITSNCWPSKKDRIANDSLRFGSGTMTGKKANGARRRVSET